MVCSQLIRYTLFYLGRAMSNINHNNQLLVEAARKGDAQTIKMLIPLADPRWESSLALMRAAEYGCRECVLLLLPYSCPRDHASRALMMAVARGWDLCVDELFEHSDYQKVLEILRNDNLPRSPTYDAFEARVLREKLLEYVGTAAATKRRVM